MNTCIICDKELIKNQKKCCSHECRNKYCSYINKGMVSWNKGIPMREESKIKLSKSIKGVKKSNEFKEKCRARMKGISFFKGKKHKKESKLLISEANSGKNHYNYQNKNSTGNNKSNYSIMLRRKKNGFTEEIYYKRISDQDNKCAICNKEFNENIHMLKKSADHCHKNNIARGILCRKCNLMLGNAEDNVYILNNAIKYLDIWKRTS